MDLILSDDCSVPLHDLQSKHTRPFEKLTAWFHDFNFNINPEVRYH